MYGTDLSSKLTPSSRAYTLLMPGPAAVSSHSDRFTSIGRWMDRYWDAIRFNVPYWPVMVYNLGCWALLPRERFFDPKTVPGTEVLEANWKSIRAELDAVLASRGSIPAFQQVDPGQRRLTDDDGWKSFVFIYGGASSRANHDRCPETAGILDRVPNLYTAFFSILAPGKRIPVHSGALKGLLRVQLPLLVPEGECWIEVGGERRSWTEGETLVFDDTFLHRACNLTGSDRVVLFLDVVRPMPWRWLDRFNRWVLDKMTGSKRVREAIERADRATVHEGT